MKCPKCNDSALMCKRPVFQIHETGRLHFTRKAVEMGKKVDTVDGNSEEAIYYCEGCGFSGNGEDVFHLVISKHQQDDAETIS